MGKGNRKNQQKLNDQLAQEEKLLAKEQAKKSKKKSDRMVAVACIVIAVLIVGILVLNILSETGVFLRTQDAMYLNGNKNVAVNAAMMTYFVNDYITSWYNNYYIYIQYGLIELDMNEDFRSQKMTSQAANYMGDSSLVGKSWYDFFMETAMENVEMYITYANAGYSEIAKGNKKCELTKEDYDEIDETIKALKKSLRESQMTIADQYGKGVTESDIRACLELTYRAQKFGEYNRDTLKENLEKNDDPVKKYPNDHKEDFVYAEYLSYTIRVYEKSSGDQEKYAAAIKDAQEAAKLISQATTPADFVKLIEDYKKSPSAFIGKETSTETGSDVTETATETATETDSSTGTETEKETTDPMEKYTGTIFYETEEGGFGEWVFEDTAETYDVFIEEESATELVTVKKPTGTATETGTKAETEETTTAEVETDKDGNIIYENFAITVYMLTSKPAMDEKHTHNFAYLISDNKLAAEKFLAEYLKAQKKDGESFVDLAEKYTPEHEHTSEEHDEPVYSYDNVVRGKHDYFNDDYQKINEWIEAEGRKAGDYTDKIMEITVKSGSGNDAKETKYYAVVYFEKQAEAAWYADAFNGALQDSIDKWYEDAQKSNPVIPNHNVIDDLTIIGG